MDKFRNYALRKMVKMREFKNKLHSYALSSATQYIGLNVYGTYTYTSIQQRTTCFNEHSLDLQIFVFLIPFISFSFFFEEKLLSTFPFRFILCHLSCHRSKCHRFISLLCLLFYYLFFSRFFFSNPHVFVYIMRIFCGFPQCQTLEAQPFYLLVWSQISVSWTVKFHRICFSTKL